ncbi:hypothetical protein BDZ45DRAFT_796395 [Acephala macrosclerotiorum]|nr:hypothetical protein BDZ45DRAFT_796395 [Acephala macrosclerotiorum]
MGMRPLDRRHLHRPKQFGGAQPASAKNGDIYTLADRVVIWLGLRSDGTTKAIEEISSQVIVDFEMGTMKSSDPRRWRGPPNSAHQVPSHKVTFWQRKRQKFLGSLAMGGPDALCHVEESSEALNSQDVIYALLHLRVKRERKIVIKPDYSRTVGGIYQNLVLRYVDHFQELDLLRLCDLEQKRDDAPTLVPNLCNTHLPCPFEYQSASLKSVPKGQYLGSGVLRLAGVAPATVKQAESVNIGGDTCRDLLRESMSTAFCLAIRGRRSLSDSCLPAFFRDIQLVVENPLPDDYQLSEDEHATLDKKISADSYLVGKLKDRSFITTNEGFTGLAPAGAQNGGVVSVLLGCRSPILLRPVANGRHQVVGACSILGLDHGEALLGPIPSQYRPVIDDYPDDKWLMIFDQDVEKGIPTMQDPRVVVFEGRPTVGGPKRQLPLPKGVKFLQNAHSDGIEEFQELLFRPRAWEGPGVQLQDLDLV